MMIMMMGLGRKHFPVDVTFNFLPLLFLSEDSHLPAFCILFVIVTLRIMVFIIFIFDAESMTRMIVVYDMTMALTFSLRFSNGCGMGDMVDDN